MFLKNWRSSVGVAAGLGVDEGVGVGACALALCVGDKKMPQEIMPKRQIVILLLLIFPPSVFGLISRQELSGVLVHAGLRLTKLYTVGVTTSESSSAIVNPPMTPMARGCKSSAPAPNAKASGNMPSIAANEVINTGRKRRRPDRSRARRKVSPALR